MRLTVFLLGILLHVQQYSQNTITGTVIDASSRQPVAGSSVFITNTSKGTTTDQNGQFALTNVPTGKHELVISSIGFETNVFSFDDARLPLQLRVELKIKVKELKGVKVESSVEEGWDKWGKLFMDNFIGLTPNANRCEIQNKNSIKFRYFKGSHRVIAYSDEQLIIENKALGYKINYQLEHFEVNFNEGSSVFLGYSLFEDVKEKKENFKKRNESYNGSMMHFVRSLFSDSLQENGFEVKRMFRIYDEEKKRVKDLYQKSRVIKPIETTGGIVRQVVEFNLPQDSLSYYREVMGRRDYTEIYQNALLTADSLIAKQDGQYKLLYFPGFLTITYSKENEDPGYLKSIMENRKPGKQRSLLYLLNDEPVWIEANGNYFDPQNMYALGYWSWSDKMADNLPLDFMPIK